MARSRDCPDRKKWVGDQRVGPPCAPENLCVLGNAFTRPKMVRSRLKTLTGEEFNSEASDDRDDAVRRSSAYNKECSSAELDRWRHVSVNTAQAESGPVGCC